MKLEYTKRAESVYLPETDEFDDYEEKFYYEPDSAEVAEALSILIYRDYFASAVEPKKECLVKKAVKNLISDSDTQKEFEKFYYDELVDFFRKDAESEMDG